MVIKNYMNRTLLVLITVIFIFIVVPLSNAMENPTVDVDISMAGIDQLYVNITINNPSQEDISLTRLDFSISDPIGSSGSMKWKTPLLLKANKSITYSSKEFITAGDPFKRFYYRSSANITISGSVFVEADSDSFVVPFHKTTTIFSETDGVNHAISPYITDINFAVSELTDEKGVVKMIITTINISIYNPNPVAFYLPEFDCDITAMYKKDEKMRRLKSLPGCCSSSDTRLIMPMDIYVYSIKRTISDKDTIQYFTSKEPKYIKIKGSAFLIPNDTGWSPAYFETDFNTMITINGSGISEEVTPVMPTPTPISASTPDKSLPGFKVVFTTMELLAMAFLLKRRN